MICPRCDAYLSMWDAPLCSYCAYPEADTRNNKETQMIKKWIKYLSDKIISEIIGKFKKGGK